MSSLPASFESRGYHRLSHVSQSELDSAEMLDSAELLDSSELIDSSTSEPFPPVHGGYAWPAANIPADRESVRPLAMDVGVVDEEPRKGMGSFDFDTESIRLALRRLPPGWLGMAGYVAAGVFLGLAMIVAMTFTRSDAAAAAAAPGAITSNVIHLHSAQVGTTCWRETRDESPARVTVSMEVGLDGKVRYAAAAGATASMRSCVEAYVRAWEFLPQAQASAMVLPVEIDRR